MIQINKLFDKKESKGLSLYQNSKLIIELLAVEHTINLRTNLLPTNQLNSCLSVSSLHGFTHPSFSMSSRQTYKSLQCSSSDGQCFAFVSWVEYV